MITKKQIAEARERETPVCVSCHKAPFLKFEEDNVRRGLLCVACELEFQVRREDREDFIKF